MYSLSTRHMDNNDYAKPFMITGEKGVGFADFDYERWTGNVRPRLESLTGIYTEEMEGTPGKSKGGSKPKDGRRTRSRLLRRLQPRNTSISPEESEDTKSEDSQRTKESLHMQILQSSKTKKEAAESSSPTPITSQRESSYELNDLPSHEFRQFAQEAITTLERIAAERQRRPWWERFLLYLKSIWLDEPIRSRRPSKLLFWHIHAHDGQNISNTPITNGEYVVTSDSKATTTTATTTTPKHQRSMRTVMHIIRNFSRSRDADQIKLDSPPESKKLAKSATTY